MSTTRIERELMRGAGPVAVLKLLQSGEKYGYELVEALERKTGGILAMGQSTLYPMLYNLESKGLIRSEWRAADTGRQRRYYRLTARGKKRLESDTEQWRAVARAMNGLGILPQPRLAGDFGGAGGEVDA